MKTWGIRCGALLVGLFFHGPNTAFAQINSPIDVPLVTVDLGGYSKLGIWLGVGGGTPQLFEFDTGGAGLYAVYNSTTPAASPWWGTAFCPTGTPVNNSYDSGLTYTGEVVKSSITIYGSSSPSSQLASTPSNTLVAQTSTITDNGETLWPGPAAPVDNAFYGDFGVSLKWGTSAVSNPLAQLIYGTGLTQGFIVHAGTAGSTSGANLRIGLSAEDMASFSIKIPMASDPAPAETFPGTGAPARPLQLVNGPLSLYQDGLLLYMGTAGVAFDTGNPTPGLHNPSDGVPASFTTTGPGDPYLNPGLDLVLTAAQSDNVPIDYFSLPTGLVYGENYVYVQDSNLNYYLNVGMPLFNQYDVMFDMEDGILGLRAVPEVQTCWLMLAGGIILVLGMKRQSRIRIRAEL